MEDPLRPGVCIPVPPPPPVITDFPRPDIVVNCLADGVSVVVSIPDEFFDGVMYVKGHANDPQCRKAIAIGDTVNPLDFTVDFDTCGLFHFQVRCTKFGLSRMHS